jgi:hypothetical protein
MFFLVFLKCVVFQCLASSNTPLLLNNPGDICFFTLPGQGSFNIVGMRDENNKNIAFLFDAGIDSTKTHVKLDYFTNDFPATGFLVRGQFGSIGAAKQTQKKLPPQSSSTLSFSSPPREKLTVGSSIGGRASAQLVTQSVVLDSLIQSVFSQLAPNLIFVFLSHPDEDHINFVDQISQLNNGSISTVFFLCGDWLSGLHDPRKGQVIQNRLASIQARDVKKTLLYMPYYWKKQYSALSDNTLTAQTVASIEELLLTSRGKGTFFETWVRSQNHVTWNIGLGDLLSQLSPFDKVPNQSTTFSLDLTQEGNQKNTTIQFLNNIHIWLLNHQRSNINAQSYLMSCTFPQLNMSFVFTGDADDSTFKELNIRMGQNNPAQILRGKGIDTSAHLIWLFLPHHGSDENHSDVMYALFEPDAYMITAGNGAQHGHPRSDIVDQLQLLSDRFWRQYRLTDKQPKFPFFKFMSAETKNQGLDKRYPAIVHYTEDKGAPVFCTNIAQCFYMDQYGNFYQQLDVAPIEYATGKEVTVHLNRHSYELTLSQVDNGKIRDMLKLLDPKQDKEFIEREDKQKKEWFVPYQEKGDSIYYQITSVQPISAGSTSIKTNDFYISEFNNHYFLYFKSNPIPQALLFRAEEKKTKLVYGYQLTDKK